MSDAPTMQSASDYQPTPQGLAERWSIEIGAAKKALEAFHERGDKIVKLFIDDRDSKNSGTSRLNLFHADARNKKAILVGNMPRVRSRRRFADPDDDVARVSAEMQERLLNTDIERDGDGYRYALDKATEDWTRPGLGVMRHRYVVEWGDPIPAQAAKMGPCACSMTSGSPMPECPTCHGTGQVEIAPAVAEQPQKSFEDVETDYVQWKDFLWSPARHWAEVRWVAFKADMPKEDAAKRFGKALANQMPFTKSAKDGEGGADAPWSRACVWEIWDRDTRTAYWHCEGLPTILDSKPDPLGLELFFPCPEPLFANPTTSKLVPTADYVIGQDGYEEVNELSTRIRALVRAAKVVGAYDQACPELARLLDEACENELVPIANWQAFVGNGGIAGSIALLPLQPIIEAIMNLVSQRNVVIQSLNQVTGNSDIMRGQASEPATATEQRIKARMGTTRTKDDQRTLARFASAGQRIRAEIIAKHFDAKTIIERSNVMRTVDAPLAQQGAQLLKDEFSMYRIEVDADSLSMTDYDAVKQEAGEYLQALMSSIKEVIGVAQVAPWAVSGLLELTKAGLSVYPAAAKLESVFDQLVAEAKKQVNQPKPPPPPDPKLKVVEAQTQADMAKTKVDVQAHAAMKQIDVQAETQKQQAQAFYAPRQVPAQDGGLA